MLVTIYMMFLGLPKPAIIKQEKAILFSKSFQIFDLCPSDVLYTCTPLYHTAGGGMGLMSTIDQGKDCSIFIPASAGLVNLTMPYSVKNDILTHFCMALRSEYASLLFHYL